MGRLHVRVLSDFSEGFLEQALALAFVVWRFAFGFEARLRRGDNPWVLVYVGWWAIEFYWDGDGSWNVV